MKRSLAGLVTCVLVLIDPAPAWTTSVWLRLAEDDGGAEIVLEWPDHDVEAHAEIDGRELLVRFTRPLDVPVGDMQRLESSLWIHTWTLGYDSILLRAARDVRFEVQHDVARTHICLQRLTSIREDSAPGTPIQLVQARLWMATRRYEDAAQLLGALRAREPRNAQVVATLAELEALQQRRMRAVDLYAQAAALQPGNEHYQRELWALRRFERPHLTSWSETRRVEGGTHETLLRWSAALRLRRALTLGVTSERHTVDGRDVLRTRARHEMSLEHESASGSTSRGTLLFVDGDPGMRLLHRVPGVRGAFAIGIEYRAPFWQAWEGLLDGVHRHHARLARTQRWSRAWESEVALTASAYGNAAGSGAARSFGAQAQLTHQRMASPWAVTYALDVESVISRDAWVPVFSREVHALYASYARRWRADVSGAGFAGLALDRLGGSGPFLGLELDWDPRGRVSARAWIEQRLNTTDTAQRLLRLGAAAVVHF